jgi:signal transduction histidine kinase
MIERLLDYSRLQAGRAALNPRPLELARHVEHFLSGFDCMQPGQRLINEIPAGMSGVVDPDALDRILSNLVSNACKYAGPDATVRIRASNDSDQVVIAVDDNGPGISEDYQDHLFDRFYQVPGTSTHQGTGIGLAIVRQYAEMHGGSVHYQNIGDGGSTFVVSLPQPRRATP